MGLNDLEEIKNLINEKIDDLDKKIGDLKMDIAFLDKKMNILKDDLDKKIGDLKMDIAFLDKKMNILKMDYDYKLRQINRRFEQIKVNEEEGIEWLEPEMSLTAGVEGDIDPYGREWRRRWFGEL